MPKIEEIVFEKSSRPILFSKALGLEYMFTNKVFADLNSSNAQIETAIKVLTESGLTVKVSGTFLFPELSEPQKVVIKCIYDHPNQNLDALVVICNEEKKITNSVNMDLSKLKKIFELPTTYKLVNTTGQTISLTKLGIEYVKNEYEHYRQQVLEFAKEEK